MGGVQSTRVYKPLHTWGYPSCFDLDERDSNLYGLATNGERGLAYGKGKAELQRPKGFRFFDAHSVHQFPWRPARQVQHQNVGANLAHTRFARRQSRCLLCLGTLDGLCDAVRTVDPDVCRATTGWRRNFDHRDRRGKGFWQRAGGGVQNELAKRNEFFSPVGLVTCLFTANGGIYCTCRCTLRSVLRWLQS